MRRPQFVVPMLEVLAAVIFGAIVGTSGPIRTLSRPIMAATLMAQRQSGALEGKVVDEAGKPVVGAQIVFYAPALWRYKVKPVEVQAATDADGRFRLITPSLPGVQALDAQIWAYRPGLAISWVRDLRERAQALVLHSAAPRTVKIEGPDGQPVARARVSPRVLAFAAANFPTDVPDTLAEARAVTTGPDGNAMFDCLAKGDKLVAVRIAALSIGTQDLLLVEEPGRGAERTTITLRLKPTNRLRGRVRNRAGDPVANQIVEIWLKGGDGLDANPVRFKNGPLLTAADGSFQTPDNLLVGSSYRVVVRAPGMEPILSNWITIGERPRVLLPMIQRPLRTISGHVVDRQGKPVVGVEVFQSGDGPERTATVTDGDGRFALGGFRQGPAFLFARGEGFRFFGRLIKPGEADITIELTRTSERPTREMWTLGETIPLQESRDLARRLIDPLWEAAVLQRNRRAQYRALRSLAAIDPVGAQQKLVAMKDVPPRVKAEIDDQLARAQARTDPAEAEARADAIAVPADPARIQRRVEAAQRWSDEPTAYLLLAFGLKSRDEGAAHLMFQTAMRRLDELMNEPAPRQLFGAHWILLPVVEQIDPALVPEYFWRIVAMRRPAGDPRSDRDFFSSRLVVLLAWYDRDVAAALFEPMRVQIEQTDDQELARSPDDFLGWAIFDPRKAVARLEQVPILRGSELGADSAREQIAEILGLSHEERWRWIWRFYTAMAGLLDRDVR